jgi:hypothetical protein
VAGLFSNNTYKIDPMKRIKILEFLVDWLIVSNILFYYFAFKGIKLGFIEITSILVVILILTLILFLIDYLTEKY